MVWNEPFSLISFYDLDICFIQIYRINKHIYIHFLFDKYIKAIQFEII